MNSILGILNPLTSKAKKNICTPWGSLSPEVDIFPIVYLIIMYGLIYILPYGRDVIGMSWFDWLRSEDGPLEWIQFFLYLGATIYAIKTLSIKAKNGLDLNLILWGLLVFLCFFVAGEEISWGERLTGYGLESIRAINFQGESNIHNLHFFHHILLDPSFEISCILFGWIGWNYFPKLDSLPAKRYSLYFLSVALFYFYFDISYSSTIKQIRNDQEIFELLMALGLFLHCRSNAIGEKYRLKSK